MTHFAFLHTLHVHAQHIDRAARLAASIRDSVSAICFYAETQASLYARAGAGHYLLVEGESAWLQRFFAIPHCPQVSGVVALVNDDAGPADLARLMLADADICLQGLGASSGDPGRPVGAGAHGTPPARRQRRRANP